MAVRKAQPVAEPLVRISEVLAVLGGGGNPAIWQADAEALAAGLRGR